MSDFIKFDGFEAQISALINDLNRAKDDVDSSSEEAAYRAAEIIRREQVRLFGKASFKRDKKKHTYRYASGALIKIVREKNSRVYKLKIGYNTETLRQYPELLVIEFGRPGKSARRSKLTDSKKRKKGDFPQNPHIRAGYFLAKDKAVDEFNERLFEIVKRDFCGE